MTERYHKLLKNIISLPQWHSKATHNYAYLQVLFTPERELLKTMEGLRQHNIQTRRHFYPSLAAVLPYLPSKQLPVTDDIAKRVLCLPLYYDLELKDVKRICQLVREVA